MTRYFITVFPGNEGDQSSVEVYDNETQQSSLEAITAAQALLGDEDLCRDLGLELPDIEVQNEYMEYKLRLNR